VVCVVRVPAEPFRLRYRITATLEALAAHEEPEALVDRVLNAQTVVDLKKPPA